MFVWVGVLILAVLAQCVFFMKKAWAHGLEIGLTSTQLKKGLTTGISVSILPTLPVLIVFLSLTPLLGTPLPWLRLSIIGSAAYEAYAASIGVQAMGEVLEVGAFTQTGWVAAAWVMTVGGSACVLWAICAIKPISVLYGKAEKIDMKLVMAIGTGCLVGVMAYASVAYGLGSMSNRGIVFLISFACGALLVFVQKKRPAATWISDFLMAGSMLVAMAAACVIL